MKHRVTITLEEEVLIAYKQMTARSGGSSFSKFVNDWLATTAEAADNMVKQIHLAHIEPQLALNELILFQEKMREESIRVSQTIRELQDAAAAKPAGDRSLEPHKRPEASATPLTNRGVKLRTGPSAGGPK